MSRPRSVRLTRWQLGGRVCDGVQLEIAGNAFELHGAAALKVNAGPCDDVFDGLRDEHLPRLGLGSHAGADMDRDAGDLAVDQFTLTGVEPCPHLDAELLHRLGDRLGAGDGASRAIEAREESIADPTTSVNKIVASIRSGSGLTEASCQLRSRNSSMWAKVRAESPPNGK